MLARTDTTLMRQAQLFVAARSARTRIIAMVLTVALVLGLTAPLLMGDAHAASGTNGPYVAMAPCDANGGWTVTPSGTVTPYGDAETFGSVDFSLAHPIVGMAATPDCGGYWLVASDGGIFTFGDATFYGSTGAMQLNQPIVGMAATPDGGGYWLVASDGGIFTFGDATFYGSTGAIRLNQPIVGMAATPSGHGYWLVASDGGIFTFGDAAFMGSTGAMHLNQPIIGMAATPNGHGYWLIASDGGIFTFGNAPFYGAGPQVPLASRVIGMNPAHDGYWLVTSTDTFAPFGPFGSGSTGTTTTTTQPGTTTTTTQPGSTTTTTQPTNLSTLAGTISASAAAAVAPNIATLIAQQTPTNPAGLWIGGNPAYWFVPGGPAEAAAAVAATTGNQQMLSDAEQTFNTLIADYHQANGSYVSGTTPTDVNTMFFTCDLGLALWAAHSMLPAATVTAWTNDVADAANFLVANGNLRWYTNGNIAIGNTLVMALAYAATGNPIYQTYETEALNFAVAPPQSRWPGFGLTITKQPTLSSGADGAGYFAESGGGAPGFDANYTQFQLDQLSRLYLVTKSPEVLYLINLEFNQEWPRVTMTNGWQLNTSGGTRHPQPDRYIPFDTPALSVLAVYAGRSDLLPYVTSQEENMETIQKNSTAYWNPGQEADFGREEATYVLLGLAGN